MASILAAEAAGVGIGVPMMIPAQSALALPEVGRDGRARKALLPLATRVTTALTSLPPHGLWSWRQSC